MPRWNNRKRGRLRYIIGELTLTNHGVIRADHLQLLLPDDEVYFRYELLSGVPESLGAKQRVTVPYRERRTSVMALTAGCNQ